MDSYFYFVFWLEDFFAVFFEVRCDCLVDRIGAGGSEYLVGCVF